MELLTKSRGKGERPGDGAILMIGAARDAEGAAEPGRPPIIPKPDMSNLIKYVSDLARAENQR